MDEPVPLHICETIFKTAYWQYLRKESKENKLRKQWVIWCTDSPWTLGYYYSAECDSVHYSQSHYNYSSKLVDKHGQQVWDYLACKLNVP